jgi:hypothetical protein
VIPVTIVELILFGFTLLGLVWAPAGLGRFVWVFPAGLGALALFLWFAPANVHPAWNPWVHLVLSQIPWLLFVLDLVFNGRISRELGSVSIRALLAFSLFRFMGARFVFSAITGDLMPEFAIEAASGEVLAALGALILWAFYRPKSKWYRGILIFWNTYALMMALGLNFRILRADPGLPLSMGHASREVHQYFTSWPNGLDAFFWIPVAIAIHAWIFWALFKTTRPDPDVQAPPTPA